MMLEGCYCLGESKVPTEHLTDITIVTIHSLIHLLIYARYSVFLQSIFTKVEQYHIHKGGTTSVLDLGCVETRPFSHD